MCRTLPQEKKRHHVDHGNTSFIQGVVTTHSHRPMYAAQLPLRSKDEGYVIVGKLGKGEGQNIHSYGTHQRQDNHIDRHISSVP